MHTKLISPYKDRKEKRMKKLFTRATAIIMGISMAAGVGVAIAAHGKEATTVDAAETSYSITFKTGSGDGTKATTSSAMTLFTESTYVTGNATTATNAYYNGSNGLKLGTSSASGSLAFSLSAAGQVEATRVKVNAKRYNSGKAATIQIGNLTAQDLTADFADYEFALTGELTSLSITASKYTWVSSVSVYFNNEEPTKTVTGLEVLDGDANELANGDTINVVGSGTTAIAEVTCEVSYSTGSPDGLVDITSEPTTGFSVETLDNSTYTMTFTSNGDYAVTIASQVDETVFIAVTYHVTGIVEVLYERITSVDQLRSGLEFIIAKTDGSYVMKPYVSGNNCPYVESSVNSQGKIPEANIGSGYAVLTLGGSSGAWTITDQNNLKYYGTASNNYLKASSGATDTWSISIDDTNHEALITSAASSRWIAQNASTKSFATYANDGQWEVAMYTIASNDTTTALSVSPNTWSGYDTDTLDVSDFTVSCTTTASDSGYLFQGIGSGEDDNFVARVSDFSSGTPTKTDTRLQWKAKYPTTEGGSTYLYAHVSLTVTEDTVSSISVSGSMTKKSYYVGEEWNRTGLTATATYKSGKQTDVSEEAVWTYSPDSPALNVTSVVATATFGGKSGNSNAQSVTVSKTNPIQALYTKASGASVDVYGYYVGFLDGTGPVIMDGDYGIVIYNKTADVSGYTENETILHVTGSISIYKGLYEIGSATMSVASGTFTAPDTPVVYTSTGNETADYASRLTTVTGTPSVEGSPFDSAAGTADITITFTVGAKSVKVFYKRAAQTADATAYASMKAAVEGSNEITIKGFTGWYDGFQVQMNGVVEAVETYTAEDFAQDLLDQTDAVCTGWEEGDDNHDALVGIWSNLASADKYPSLPSEQKTILAEAERNEKGTVVEQAMARYDYLTGKYKLNNFINGRTPVVVNSIYNNTTINASNANMIAIIVIASIALVATTGAVTAIIIKKRATH